MGSGRVYGSFTEAYYDLVGELTHGYTYVSSPRGMEVREKLGVTFELTDPRARLPYVPERDFGLAYSLAEIVWYLIGNDETDWIANYAPFWKGITDDGVTANSAYGARLFRPHPRIAGGKLTQWDYALDELKRDPDSRRAVMHIRTPCDSVAGAATKDMPCTLSLHPFIRGGKLDMVVNMRSSDLILGIAYDVPFFTLLQEMLANELGVRLGSYVHTSNSLHVYEKHYTMCDDILRCEGLIYSPWPSMPSLPKTDVFAAARCLDIVQREARTSLTAEHLDAALAGFMSIVDLDPYWHDWARVLLMHRARKLKLDGWFEKTRASLDFDGFKVFGR